MANNTFNSQLTQSNPTVLITGANGLNGAELVKLFVARGLPVRAMVRDASRAREIVLPGVEVVQGDFNRPETLVAALIGIERAFLLSPSSENAAEQQIAFVEAAKKSGAKHIVKLSQFGADSLSSQRFLRYHGQVEDAMRASGLSYTFLRPNLFMQALVQFAPMIKGMRAFFAPARRGPISIVDVRDIAQVAFASLTQPGHENKIYDITGSQSLTRAQMAAQLSGSLGHRIRFVNLPAWIVRIALLKMGLPVWAADGVLEEYVSWKRGDNAPIRSGVCDATGKAPRTFEQFARDYAPAFG